MVDRKDGAAADIHSADGFGHGELRNTKHHIDGVGAGWHGAPAPVARLHVTGEARKSRPADGSRATATGRRQQSCNANPEEQRQLPVSFDSQAMAAGGKSIRSAPNKALRISSGPSRGPRDSQEPNP